jgi:uncharacterized protein YdeI (YjbR/CyaY-like superfamily)
MSSTSISRSTSEPPGWDPTRVRFFASRSDLRAWFETNHETTRELWVGFYKAQTGRADTSYLEAVEEALCFGWIDTTVRRVDVDRYANRFVPRRPDSFWTSTNRALFRDLERRGLVTPAGRAAYPGRRMRARPETSGTSVSRRGTTTRRRRPGSS